MTHDRAKQLLPAYADRQLGPIRHFLVGRHIARCATCVAELEAIHAMRTALRTSLPVHRAPPALAARIASALPRESVPQASRQPLRLGPIGFGRGGFGDAGWGRSGLGDTTLGDGGPGRADLGRAGLGQSGLGQSGLGQFGLGQMGLARMGLGYAGAAMAGGFGGILLTLVALYSVPAADPIVADVVGDHVRSMMADHLTDVATSDQHTVKPWLSARLDLSPVVKDFAAQGYPLVGGRLDYVDGHRAAAIVYRRDKHVINLFAFVSGDTADAPPRQESQNGFNVVRWRMGGLTYVAVSDVEAAQLLAFVRLVEGT